VATTDAKILLIEAGPQVLAAFAPKLQRYTQRRLQKMGVEVWLNTMARDMDSGSVTVTGPDGDRRVPARTRIWAAGVQASPLAAILAAATGADTDRVAAVFNWARALTFSKNRPHRTITYEHAQNELAEHHYQRE
jgi:NADH:ubiquinone reductase (H+-translocating)